MRVGRPFLVLLLVGLLCAGSAQAGQHFGFPIAVYSYDLHPSEPLDQHAAGNLGIIRPSYARSYLYAAYRWIEGAPMATDEQQALTDYWQVKLKLAEPKEENDDGGWFDLRESLDIPLPDDSGPDAPNYDLDEYNFIYYLPCSGNGFAIATDRLRQHIARFGETSNEVREWVTAQDSVFRACTKALSANTIPGEAPPDVHRDIRRDRAYQIAATLFIGRRFRAAEQRFRTIAPDPSYPGGLWAPYMVGRSILWQARREPDGAERLRLLRNARFELQNVLQNDRLAHTHDAARFLLLRILIATDPAPGARLLGLRLMSPLRAASRPQDLIQYFQLLDVALGWPRREPTVPDPATLGQQDNLTDWILTFQGRAHGAPGHAVERWRQTGSVAWLIAALQQAPPNHPALPDMLAAAAETDRSPGSASVQYYRAERLIEAGRRPEARATLDALIPTLAGRPSSANRARALRTELSESFAEALDYGIAEPISFGEMTSSGKKTQPWQWADWAEGDYGPHTPRPMVTPALARILNASVPLDRFANLVLGDARMPEALRREILLTAWIRAVLLDRWDLVAPLALACAKQIPETAPYMKSVAAADEQSQSLLAKLALLRFPGIGAEIRSGIGRDAPLDEIQRDALNWWWWQGGYGVGLGGHPDSAPLDWITPAERRQADGEWARIVALGEGHDWLYAGVLQGCDVRNPPAACAEALYRAGTSCAAVGYWHDPTWLHGDLMHMEDRVEPILRRHFPRSAWSRNLNTDVEQLENSAYGGDGTYRRVVPYLR